LSSQATVNFYQEVDESGKEPIVLHSWPGETLFGMGAGADRGQHIMSGVNYRVTGSTLFEVSSTGAHTSRGTILGSDRCIFANDGENMFIVNNGFVQQYNRLTQTLSTVTDSDIVGSNSVDFLNNQFIYSKSNLFIISDVGDGSSASGLNAAQAESQPDDLVRAYVFDQIVYMFGELTIEPWYNSGSGLPPFDRIDTQMMSIGLGAIHSVDHNDNFMYWLGDDRQVYQASGGTPRRVSSIAVSHAMEGYKVINDAVGMTLTIEGQNFYILSFPTENQTWALNERLGPDGWFELSADTSRGKYNVSSHSFINGNHLVADELNGKLYKLDLNAFDNDGETIQRTRVISSIHGGLAGVPGKRIQMSRFELIIEAGVGLISGQGENPKIMIEASYDGGKSFGAGTWMRVGRQGETTVRAEWFNLRSFYDLIIRITTSDPVHYTLISGAIDIKLAGR
jgi:hypothetical protein